MRIVYFHAVVFYLVCQVLCVNAHFSMLNRVEDNVGNNITAQFGAIVGQHYNSTPADQANVCYGTFGTARAQANPPYGILPRCHSEFYLLRDILATGVNLNGCSIHIENEEYPPCKLARGQINPYNGEVERNHGTTCHVFLRTFAQNNNCRIRVTAPKGNRTYP
jgi:hypothetical protein